MFLFNPAAFFMYPDTVLVGHGMLWFPMMHVYDFACMHGQQVAWRLPCFWKMSVLFYEKHLGEFIIAPFLIFVCILSILLSWIEILDFFMQTEVEG